jgi:steroid 5-alpha reductase family enzyme
MIGQLLLVNAILLVIYMSLWFLVAYRRDRIDTVDSAWGSGFALAGWAVALQYPSPRSLIIAVLITIWSARLTAHLAKRTLTKPEDPRYVELAKKWKGSKWPRAYFSIYLLQGLFVWVVSLPAVFAATKHGPVNGWAVLGVLLWLAGFACEALADRQLAAFLQTHKGKNMESGLWRYSRHPNYFGELLQWWAIGLIAVQTLHGWYGLIGPLALSILIIFVSGIPPIEKRRQGNADYEAYKQRTSQLIPLPPRST